MVIQLRAGVLRGLCGELVHVHCARTPENGHPLDAWGTVQTITDQMVLVLVGEQGFAVQIPVDRITEVYAPIFKVMGT